METRRTIPLTVAASTIGTPDPAHILVSAFYRGLGADASASTLAIRRRDAAIARQLVDAGATPAEAEAYARDVTSAPGRLAPVDLRSFERERLSWLTRRRQRDAPRHLVDRTGQRAGRDPCRSPATVPPDGVPVSPPTPEEATLATRWATLVGDQPVVRPPGLLLGAVVGSVFGASA